MSFGPLRTFLGPRFSEVLDEDLDFGALGLEGSGSWWGGWGIYIRLLIIVQTCVCVCIVVFSLFTVFQFCSFTSVFLRLHLRVCVCVCVGACVHTPERSASVVAVVATVHVCFRIRSFLTAHPCCLCVCVCVRRARRARRARRRARGPGGRRQSHL